MTTVLWVSAGPPGAHELRRIRRARRLAWEGPLPPDALFFAPPDAEVVPPSERPADALCLAEGPQAGIVRGPLGGQRVVLTRQARDMGRTVRAVTRADGRPIPFPVFETRPLPPADVLAALSRREWRFVAVTSPEGARCLGHLAGAVPQPFPPVAAVGQRTRRALERHGLSVQVTARRASGLGLATELGGAMKKGESVLLLRSAEASSDLPRALHAMGFIVEDVPLYAAFDVTPGTRRALGELMGARAIGWLTFFSGGSARRFATLFPDKEWRAVPTAVVGPVTARQATELGFSVRAIAERPSPSALVDAMAKVGRPF